MAVNPIYRSPAWRKARLAVLNRDGWACQIGYRGCLGRANSADHIVELEFGGAPYALENLQAACVPCNTRKRNERRRGRRRRVGRRVW